MPGQYLRLKVEPAMLKALKHLARERHGNSMGAAVREILWSDISKRIMARQFPKELRERLLSEPKIEGRRKK